MAEVWKAQDSRARRASQRTLVVKRILPHLAEDPALRRRCSSPRRGSRRACNHPNIVQVFELGDVDGEYFLAMEYVRGRDLVERDARAALEAARRRRGSARTWCARSAARWPTRTRSPTSDGSRSAHPPRRVARRTSCSASTARSSCSTSASPRRWPRPARTRTQTGTLKGKFGYMSPEQVEGKRDRSPRRHVRRRHRAARDADRQRLFKGAERPADDRDGARRQGRCRRRCSTRRCRPSSTRSA